VNRPVSPLAVAALVLGLLGVCTIPIPFVPSFCLGGVGMALAVWALRSWREEDARNRLMALTGLALGLLPWVGLTLTLSALLYTLFGGQK